MAGYSGDRFLFSDPFGKNSMNRTTRYRQKKRRLTATEQCISEDVATGTAADVEEEGVLVSKSNYDELSVFGAGEGHLSGEATEDLELEGLFHCQGEELSESGSETESEQEVADENIAEKPLYEGASLSARASSVLIMEFKIRHNLSNECLKDLLKLIKLHCPKPNECISSPYIFKKMFHTKLSIYHYYCTSCYQTVEKEDSVCPNEMCRAHLNNSRSYFIEEPILPQLQQLIQRKYKVLCEQILKFNSANVRDDICSGDLYKELHSSGVISNDNNIMHLTLTLNTDGIPIFKSSNFAFWPMYLTINELPYKMRILKENRLFGGLWHGSKPDMALFLKPLAKFLQTAFKDGIEVTVDNSKVICKVILLSCTCDLPARAAVLNFTQFNGFYGCCRCKQKGESVTRESGGTIRVFPYDEQDPTGPPRTHEESMEQAKKAAETGKAVYGVKGPSWLATTPCFNIIRGSSVDYMHCVLLGMCRHLLKLWLLSKQHDEPWYIGTKVAQMDGRLLAIKPPEEMQRTPRSLESTRQYWKAHELRAWMFHYSPVVLHGILPNLYYQHYLLLVEGVYLLLKDEVCEADIQQSSRLLMHYCFMFSSLYGKRNMSANVHALLHLPEVVRDLGPLWAHSCFPFENANGEIQKFYHGSQGVNKQVVDHVKLIMDLPQIAETVIGCQSKEYDFYTEMRSRGRHSGKPHYVVSNTHLLVGHPKCTLLLPCELNCFHEAGITLLGEEQYVMYPKIYIVSRDRTVMSKFCSRSVKRNDSCIKYSDAGICHYGIVKKIVLDATSEQCYVFIYHLHPATVQLCCDTITNAKLNDHVSSFQPPRDSDIHVINGNCIEDKCVLMEVDSKMGIMFVSAFPNKSEVE